MKPFPWIAPSILSADFSKLASEIASVKGADWIHVDVMDGHFVPNLTIGPVVVEALKRHTQLPLDCHLMVSEPHKWIESFAQAGARAITIHVEASKDLLGDLKQIRALGCWAGVSLNPATPLSAIEPVLDHVDLVLVMSVHPGFGGQKYMEGSADKIRELARARGKRKFWIEVDGGVSEKNAGELSRAGAEIFVAGSAIFKQSDRAAAVEGIRKNAHA